MCAPSLWKPRTCLARTPRHWPNPSSWRRRPASRTKWTIVTRDELLTELNELLEVERAGARVTIATAKEIAGGDLKPLVLAIHRDEARWCGVLTRAIHQLQGATSPKTGGFHNKAMAIRDLAARLAFLNRGQGWVVRKLNVLLPTIRDEAIHADLTAMLASHERNIGLVAVELPSPDRIEAPS